MRQSLKFPLLAVCSLAALAAGCSREEQTKTEQMATYDIAAEAPPPVAPPPPASWSGDAAPVAPDISRAAPGVAFTYAYSFVLADDAIGKVQREHAAACAKLGIERCRVTGMSFSQPSAGNASARLNLVIMPELAHDFGESAAATVEKAEGRLDRANVEGVDSGGAIDQSFRRTAAIRAEIARLDQRLKTSGLAKETRIELERKREGLQEQLRAESAGREDSERTLATTPMTFEYGTDGAFGSGNPFGTAASASLASAHAALSFVLLVAGFLGPWLALGALAWAAVRGIRRLLPPRAAPAEISA